MLVVVEVPNASAARTLGTLITRSVMGAMVKQLIVLGSLSLPSDEDAVITLPRVKTLHSIDETAEDVKITYRK